MKEKGALRDLIEKKKRGEITSEQAIQEIHKRGLQHGNAPNTWVVALCMVGWGVLCFISAIASATGLPVLEPLTRLPAFSFPLIITGLAVILIVFCLLLLAYSVHLRVKRGGATLSQESESIMLTKQGVYGIMRHPGAFGLCGLLFLLTVLLSKFVPFNVLSVAGNFLLWAGCYYSGVLDEELNIAKWGNEYRQYMKEVPRFNFILGVWGQLKLR